MLRSIKQLYGDKLTASDGEIGHLKDFYFDDQNWVVRYLVADTGSWLPGRQVLISPHSIGSIDPAGKVLRANLTRKQVEHSPLIKLHQSVSRQYEEEYHRYFGWPFYWQGDALRGMNSFPILARPAKLFPSEPVTAISPKPKRAGAHLISTRAVGGCHRQASNGMAGHVCDFMIDAESWAIRQLVIKAGSRFSSAEMGIPTSKIERITWDKSTMLISLTREPVEPSLAYELNLVGAAD